MFYSKNLKKINNLNHCFFSKKNGFSKGIYKCLNCGRGSKDNKKNVLRNLNFVAQKMKVSKKKLVLMNQTHSNKVIEINKNNYSKKINADAMITKMKGVAIGVVTADCAPIILYDKKNGIIGCVHAGWKGAYLDIIKNTIIRFKKLNANNKIYACVGPCIGRKSYEVDESFYNKFVSKSFKYKKYFCKKNRQKRLFDLRKFVTEKLRFFNVIVDHVNKDTFAQKTNFFSYRRASKLRHKDYGRCISAVSMI